MTDAFSHIDGSLVRTIGWTLLHFLWQGAAMAALFAIVAWVMRSRSANARYVAGCAALLLMAVAPIATFVYLGRDVAANIILQELPQDVTIEAIAIPSDFQPLASTRQIEPPSWRARMDRALPWCVAAWVVGVLLLSARLLSGWIQLQRVRRRETKPAPSRWEGRFASLARRMGVRRAVRLLECARVECPAVVGWLRPVILVPASAMSGLSVAQLESILAHELAHVRRHDYLVNLVQSAIETVLFYHPAVWWVSRRVRHEREHACDDVAAQVCGDRVLYADALVTLEELRPFAARLALAANDGALLPRVRRLLGRPAANATAPAAWWPGAIVVLAMIVSLAATLHYSHAAEPAPSDPTKDAPTTAPSAAQAVLPEDLVPATRAGVIGEGDLLRITIPDLAGPGVESAREQRVLGGMLTLPIVGEIPAKGLTEAELQLSIARRYVDDKVMADPVVGVSLVESSSQTFSAIGDMNKSGRYAISGDVRLLDALAAAGGLRDGVTRVYVVRQPEMEGKSSRTIEIDVAPILRGDLSHNIVIRPGDVIMAPPAPRRDDPFSAGAVPADVAEAIARAVGRKVPGGDDAVRSAITVGPWPATGQTSVIESPREDQAHITRLAAERAAIAEQHERLRGSFGPQHPSVRAAAQARDRAEQEYAKARAHVDATSGTYYLSGGGNAGAYQITAPITVLQALIAAGYDVSRGGGQHVLITHKQASGDEPKTRAVAITDLVLAPEHAPQVRPGDLLIVRDGAPTTRPIPPTGGKYYIGGLVERPGAYEITSPITVLDALSGAGLDVQGETAKEKYVTVLRRDADGDNVAQTMKVADALKSPVTLMHIQANDQIHVTDKPPATQPAR